MKKFKCITCEKIFISVKQDKSRTPKYCCRKCFQRRIISEQTRKKMSIAKLDKTPWNKGVKMWKEKEHPRGTLGMKGLNKGKIISE